ncbi:hypothetical protein [Nocardia testacea]|uniref:hypothetical protein n=1 Tax=Nocardia testacea TaxID=248551 RepID=UPI000309A74E|nr:hypothetical protein [Nocardia testacea]
MLSYTIQGASDDTAIVTTSDGFSREVEEYSAYDGAVFHIVSRTGGQLRVRLDQDSDTGCWNIGIGATNEAKPVPNWPLRIEPSGDDYSPRLTIEAPADARLLEVTS